MRPTPAADLPMLATLAALLLAPAPALADRPYLTLRDDGYVSGTRMTEANWRTFGPKIVSLYKAAGAPLPEIISVWTAFDFSGTSSGTYVFQVSNDVKGIGFETLYDTAVFRTADAPVRSVLMHNNVLALAVRAKHYHLPLDGLAQYLFMLEVSHTWGATLRLPGADPDLLLGDPPHWSFWLDAGGSPEGGNEWRDNRDGTFTVLPRKTVKLAYSMLDLYVMGLVPASEVAPFGVLVDVTPPADVKDPSTGGQITSESFPWVGDAPLTVKARRRVVRIEDVIAKNGPRDPPFGRAPREWTLGIVLLVGPNATAAEIAAAQAALDPIAPTLAPTFRKATGNRGALRLISIPPSPPGPRRQRTR